MTVPVSALGGLITDLADGRGLAVVVAAGTNLDPFAAAARATAVLVVDVPPDTRLQAFALGPLLAGLREAGFAAQVPLIRATGVPARLHRHLIRMLRDHLSALDDYAGVLFLVHDQGRLDPISRAWIDSVAAGDAEPSVGWIVRAGPEYDHPPDGDVGALRASVLALDESQRQITRLLAVSQLALTLAEISELSGQAREACEVAAGTLRERGILAVCSDAYVLSDLELQDVVEAEVPSALRRGVQRAVLRRLRGRVDPTMLAEQASVCARPGDPLVIDILVEAMDALAEVDPDAAADYGATAVSLFPEPDERLTGIAWRLLPLLWQTARVDDARGLVRRVFAERGGAEVEAQVLLWLARFDGAPRRAVELTSAALAIPDVSSVIRARLYSVQLRALSTLGRTADVDALLPAALTEAQAAGDDDALSRLQTCDAIRHFYRGEFNLSASLTALADAAWQRSGAPAAEWMPEMIWSPHLAMVLGRPESGLHRIDRLLAELQAGSQPFATRFLHGERALTLLVMGRLPEAQDAALLAATVSQQLWQVPDGADDRLQAIALSVRLKVALHQGDSGVLGELRTILDKTDPEPDSEAAQRVGWWKFLLDDAAGETGKVQRSVDPATLAMVPWLDPADEILIGRALLTHEHHRPARDLLERAIARIECSGTHPLAVTIAAHLRGLAERDAAALDQARRGWQDLGRPLIEAAALSDFGAILLEAGDRGGVHAMEQAHTQLMQRDASRDAWRIRWFLRVHGHVLEPEAPGSLALTPTERRVVDRVGRGGSVRRIAEDLGLSPHTVTTHLRHVYAKLGISSRSELAEWVRTR
ncbi:hypothetical protein PSU4_46230 [Pseudonocardia sulfidoxydans NBRC 16205]|uniref:HTH luxR-type domain-containing protein n=2 Tax=Pseudonocardia sulfidoxydans TaxID=54011 RepID=A0A511DLH7_9PSEU|nr:LuxR family transcriptional regulator [Pseudonocardia sulfidoxydans]GEL25669.1 hypothetical protein PSU4_46230 [Pseudonocardia sulfidoxydans NBRC 16205]